MLRCRKQNEIGRAHPITRAEREKEEWIEKENRRRFVTQAEGLRISLSPSLSLSISPSFLFLSTHLFPAKPVNALEVFCEIPSAYIVLPRLINASTDSIFYVLFGYFDESMGSIGGMNHGEVGIH